MESRIALNVALGRIDADGRSIWGGNVALVAIRG